MAGQVVGMKEDTSPHPYPSAIPALINQNRGPSLMSQQKSSLGGRVDIRQDSLLQPLLLLSMAARHQGGPGSGREVNPGLTQVGA